MACKHIRGKGQCYKCGGKVPKLKDGGFPLKTTGPRETPKQEEVPFPYGGQSFMYDNGAGYKMDRAKELGYTPDATGHMPSRDYETGEYLKDKYYPTSWKSNLIDQQMDYQVYQDGESLYSRPNVKANGGWLDTYDEGGKIDAFNKKEAERFNTDKAKHATDKANYNEYLNKHKKYKNFIKTVQEGESNDGFDYDEAAINRRVLAARAYDWNNWDVGASLFTDRKIGFDGNNTIPLLDRPNNIAPPSPIQAQAIMSEEAKPLPPPLPPTFIGMSGKHLTWEELKAANPITSDEDLRRMYNVPKKANGGWIDSYEDGGEINPTTPITAPVNYVDKIDLRAIKEGIAEIESYGTDRKNPYTVLNQSGSSAQGKYQFTDWWMTKGNMPYNKFASLTKNKGENKKEFLSRVKEHFISHPELQEEYMNKTIREDYAPKVNDRAYKNITEKYGAANTIAMLHYNGASDTKKYNKLVKKGKEEDFKAIGQDKGLNVSTAKYMESFKKGTDLWYENYDKQLQSDYIKNKTIPQSSGNIIEQIPAKNPNVFLNELNITPTTQEELKKEDSIVSLDTFHDGGEVGHTHPHEDSQYSLPTYSSTVGSEDRGTNAQTQIDADNYAAQQAKVAANKQMVADYREANKTNEQAHAESLSQAKKETTEDFIKKSYGMVGLAPLESEEGQAYRDNLGFVPGLGELSDVSGMMTSAAKGDYFGAGAYAAGLALPFVPGGMVKGIGKKAYNAITNPFSKTVPKGRINKARNVAPIIEPFRYVPEGQTRVNVRAKEAPKKKAPEGVVEKTIDRLKKSSVNPLYYKNQLKDIKKTNADLEHVKEVDARMFDEQEVHQKTMDALGSKQRTANNRITKLGNVYWNKHDAGELGKDFPLTDDQRNFVKHYPGYASYLTNKPGEVVGGFNKFAYQNKPSFLAEYFSKEKEVNELFSDDLVEGFLDKNTKSVRGIKNAPDEKTAKEWLTSLGDTEARDRSLGNLGDAVYSSNSKELREAFSRGNDTAGNYGADLRLNIKGMSDDLSPIEKVNLYEQQVKHGTELVSIPGEGLMTITKAAREGHGKALKDQGIKAIDKEYSHQAERGILDESIIKLENLIDMSHAGTAKPVGQGGMWGSGTSASEDLFDYIDEIQYKKNIFRSSEEGLKWTNKYKKVTKDLEKSKFELGELKKKEDRLDSQKQDYRYDVIQRKQFLLENSKYALESELKNKINSLKTKAVGTSAVLGTYYGGKYLLENQVERARESAKEFAALPPEEKERIKKEREERRRQSRKNGGWLDTY